MHVTGCQVPNPVCQQSIEGQPQNLRICFLVALVIAQHYPVFLAHILQDPHGYSRAEEGLQVPTFGFSLDGGGRLLLQRLHFFLNCLLDSCFIDSKREVHACHVILLLILIVAFHDYAAPLHWTVQQRVRRFQLTLIHDLFSHVKGTRHVLAPSLKSHA